MHGPRDPYRARNARFRGHPAGVESGAVFGRAADAVGDCQHQHRDRKCKQNSHHPGELHAIGLAVDVVLLEGNAVIQRFVSGTGYDAIYFGLFGTDTDPALNTDFWLSSGGSHFWNRGKPTDWERQIDDLMLRQMSALDDGERRKLFVDVQKIFSTHLPMIHFAAPRIYVVASSRLTDLTPAVSRPQLLWAADSIAVRR